MRSNHLAGLDSAVVHQSGPSCSSDAHLLHSLVILTILMFLISIHAWAQSSGPQPASNPLIQLSDSQKVKIASAYGKLPLSFEANRGQSDSQIKFFSRGPGYSLFLTDHEAVLSLRGQEPREQSAVMAGPGSAPVRATQFRGDVIRLQLLGSHLPLHVNGENLLPGSANYFIGNDPTKWLSAIPTYARVRYAEVYPGVSLVYYGNQQHLEYDFVVAPGADPSSIRLRVAGVQRLEITKAGDLQVTGCYGEIAFHKPVIYQQIGGRRQPVNGKFVLQAKDTIAFSTDAYDRTKELIIDPTLSYSTYLGGAGGASYGTAISVDTAGDAFVTGVAYGTTFPTSTGAFQTSNKGASSGLFNTFVTKLNPTGTAILYSTYLGGSGNVTNAGHLNHGDYPNSIAIDAAGDAFIAGVAYSTDFPVTSGTFQTTNKAGANGVANCFITRVNPTGTGLDYSTYLGGSGVAGYSGQASLGVTGGDGCAHIAIDSAGNAYVTGTAYSNDFPVTSGAFQSANKSAGVGRPNAFAAKLNPAGSALTYSTYLGGSDGDEGEGIAIDGNGNAFVAGGTASSDFPTTNGAFQTANKAVSNGYTNAFVTQLNSTGSQLIYSTYLGGTGNTNGPANNNNGDLALSISLDSSANAYVFGMTSSLDFPVTSGAFQTVNNASNAHGDPSYFITKLKSLGSGLVYSTYLGSSSANLSASTSGITLDSSGNVYVTGYVLAADFPVTSTAYQAAPLCKFAVNGTNVVYAGPVFAELDSTGTSLVYSTYLGGSGTIIFQSPTSTTSACDKGYGIALDPNGGIYLTGDTASIDFPVTPGVLQGTAPASTDNAFVSKFVGSGGTTKGATSTTLTSDGNPQTLGTKITFTAYVQPGSGTEIPTGTVTFKVDSGAGIVVALDSTGHATYSTSGLIAGTHTITAAYSGDGNFTASSATLSEMIVGAAASIAVVSGSPQSAVYGSPFSSPLVVIVKDANGNPVPNALVSFTGVGVSLSATSATTGANGEASVTATAVAISGLSVSASTSGVTGKATFALTATKATLTVAAQNASVAFDQPIPALTFGMKGFVNGDTSSVLSGSPKETTTATQGSAPGTYPIVISVGTLAAANYAFSFGNGTLTITSLGMTATPTFSPASGTYTSIQSVTISDSTAGAVIFFTTDGTTPTSSSTKYVSAISIASTETIKAIAVTSGHSDSAVASATYTINLPVPTFSLTASPTTATITGSQSATFSITVTPQNGFAQAIGLSCSGLPSGDACSFAPSSVTPSGSPASSTLTIGRSQATQNESFPMWRGLGGGLVVSFILWPLRKRRTRLFLATLLFAVFGTLATGCGSGPPKPQGYSVIVRASGGNVQQTVTISLTVKQ